MGNYFGQKCLLFWVTKQNFQVVELIGREKGQPQDVPHSLIHPLPPEGVLRRVYKGGGKENGNYYIPPTTKNKFSPDMQFHFAGGVILKTWGKGLELEVMNGSAPQTYEESKYDLRHSFPEKCIVDFG